jgi:hypothetical protein
MSFLRTLLGALSLLLLRRPRRPARQIGPGQFWLAALLLALLETAWSAHAVEAPRAIDPDGWRGIAFVAALVLLAAYLAAAALRRAALFWPAATLLLLIETLVASFTRLIALLDPAWWQVASLGWSRASWLHLAWLLLATRRLFDDLEPFRAWRARSATALLLTLALTLPGAWHLDQVQFFYPQEWDQPEPDEPVLADAPGLDAETLLGAQPQRVDEALAALVAQRPGVVDLYLVAFAGDGDENVFRNEVLYVQRLFAQRFGNAGRSLVLVNHASTADARPLATLANLERALAGVGARIDRDEDLLFVFATTHGSEEHELYVALDPLPLRQITPARLAAAVDGSGVRHRVIVVSACYAGGFVDALRNDTTLVLTAARADRRSFGCGALSDITYFGRAYFTEALNQTASFTEAFALARARIASLEQDEGKEASEPQIATAPAIEAHLERWRAGIVPGPALAFSVIADDGRDAAEHAATR